ncbi:hypothetical protein PQX77_016504 [Marasmius sp. AFHP31]|nr:hypothetical protein PQX77_016504 [Marasmius sp. AFHP31]
MNRSNNKDVSHVQALRTLTTIAPPSSPLSTSYLSSKAAGKARMGQQKQPEADVGGSKRTIVPSKKPLRVEETDRLKREAETLRKLADESSQRLKEVEEQLSKAKKKLEGLNQECDGFRRDNQDLHWSKDELTEKLEAKKRELEQRELDWREAEKTQKERFEELEKEKKLLRKERRRLEDHLKLATEQLEGSNATRDAVRAELEKCKVEMETLKADLEKERLASAATRQELEQGSQAVREAVAVYKADTVRWNAEKKTLQDNIRERDEAILRFHAASKSKDDELESVKKSSALLEGEMKVISRSYAALQERTSADDADLTTIRHQLQCQAAELERAKSEVSRAEKKAEQGEENLRGFQAKVDRQGSRLSGFHPTVFLQFFDNSRAVKLGEDFARVRSGFADGNSSVTAVLETCDSLGERTLGIFCALKDSAASLKAAVSEPVRTSPQPTRKLASTSQLASPSSARGTDPLQPKPTPPPPSSSAPGKPSSSRPIKRPTTLPSARGTDSLQLQQPTPPTSTFRSTTSQLPSSSSSKQPSSAAQPPSSKFASAISALHPPVASPPMSNSRTPEPLSDPDSCHKFVKSFATRSPSSRSRQNRGQVILSEASSEDEGEVQKLYADSQKPLSANFVSKTPETRKRPKLASQLAGPSTSSPRPWRPRADVDSSSDESTEATEIKRPSSQKRARPKHKQKQAISLESSSSEGEDETLRVSSRTSSSKTISSRDKIVKPDRRNQLIPSPLKPQQKGDDDPRASSEVNSRLDTSAATSTTSVPSTSSAGNNTLTSPRKRLRMKEILVKKKVSRTQRGSTASATGEVADTPPRKRPRMEEASGAQSRRGGNPISSLCSAQ